ncbi:TIR domain-containing protein [Tenacibaculum sp. 190524A02b]|uniref:TIR domain-containing protein n=1 Tax=Tenacibaculum vairaonense TaxID=3137860 RepID=A0ABM9PLT1_9FLAO
MSPTEKYRLIQDIYFSLQTTLSIEEIIDILGGYGVKTIPTKTYTQKSLKQLLNHQTDDNIIIAIANDLDLSTPYLKKKAENQPKKKQVSLRKIFISHAIEDKEIVSSFIQILQSIGIDSEIIFCASFEGYGTTLGSNTMEDIKNKLNDNVLVFFILSKHFYTTSMCLMQLGAVWALTKTHISVAIPPFKLEKMRGVFQHFKGMYINEEKNLDLLKDTLESQFNLTPKRQLVWTPTRDILLRDIQQQIQLHHGKDNS